MKGFKDEPECAPVIGSEAAVLAVSEALHGAKGPAFASTATHPFVMPSVDAYDSKCEDVGNTVQPLQGPHTVPSEALEPTKLLKTGLGKEQRTEAAQPVIKM